ncbi:LPXTG cell wall anchor domain-containing protein [Micromonospora sp. WMMA1923]|uniref:LPXTG cell wall anchor domain-containing protein n=1 Tax=Micromonospora sp. WMMA1923 TaxID=3404125 RepID=UPI003B955378
MIFRNRPLARFGAAALLASGVFTGLGAPAYASGTETDLAIDVVGTRVASGTEGKLAFAKVTNKGKNTPSELAIRMDVSKVDFDKVFALPLTDGECEIEGEGEQPTLWTCGVDKEVLPGPGETIEVPIGLLKVADLKGAYRAPIKVTLISADDTDKSNNSKSAQVEFTTESGPDLTVLAPDVKNAVTVKNGQIEIGGDLHAGDTAMLVFMAINQGDAPAAGLKVEVKLPKGVTFTDTEKDCEYNPANTLASCTYDNLPLVPIQEDDGEDDKVYSGGSFYHLLSVDADVKAGALTGGVVTVDPILPTRALSRSALQVRSLPANVTGIDGGDIDASDNSDGYAVVVAAKGGSGGGGKDDDQGGLPVTGPQAGMIGGIGAAVLLAGGAMFLVARRRRVVLVAPADEKTNN